MQSNTASGAAANRKEDHHFMELPGFFNMHLYIAHTLPWQDISIVEAEAVAKSFFQYTL